MHVDFNVRLTGRADDVPLSEAGRAQAASLGQRLAAEPIAAVYASPRERTQMTAAAIAVHHGLEPRTDARIDEIDMGDWTRAPIEDLRGDAAFAIWNERRATAAPPNGEPFAAVAERAMAYVRAMAVRHAGQTIVAVSHADVIKGAVAACLELHLDHILRFEIGPASVTRLVAGDWGTKLISLNEGAAA